MLTCSYASAAQDPSLFGGRKLGFPNPRRLAETLPMYGGIPNLAAYPGVYGGYGMTGYGSPYLGPAPMPAMASAQAPAPAPGLMPNTADFPLPAPALVP